MTKKAPRRLLAPLAALYLMLLCSGCGQLEPLPPDETSGLRADLEYLCTMGEGRLPGTDGNILAQDYIKEAFQEAGLTCLEGYDDYCIPYTQELFNPESRAQTLTAVYRDGSEKQFFSGLDFYPLLCGTVNLTGAVTTDSGDPDLGGKIYLGSDVPGNKPLLQIRPGDRQSASLAGELPMLRVDGALFDELDGSLSISLTGAASLETGTVHNVVGVWKGQTRRDALVISAHFDHVGRYGGTVYTGALDNASGVAVMLEILRQTVAARPAPEYDIIFCAFNGEDMGQLGSKAFSDLPFPYERINVINIDTIGWNESDSLAINAGEEALAEQAADMLSEAGFRCAVGDFGRSDHNMLCDNGIPAITIASGGDVESVIHSTADRLDVLNIEQLLDIGTAIRQNVGAFTLIDQAEASDQSLDELSAVRTLQAEEMVEKYQPGRDEMVLYQSDDLWLCARDTSPVFGLEEVLEQYPNIYIPPELEDYHFEAFHPNGFPQRDTGETAVTHGFYAMSRDARAEGLEEGAHPVDEALFASFNSLRYCNAQGKSVDVWIYPLDGWERLGKEYPRSGETYVAGTEELVVYSGTLEVAYVCEATSSVIVLVCPIDSAGTEDAIGLDELKELMEAELPEIQRITYIP